MTDPLYDDTYYSGVKALDRIEAGLPLRGGMFFRWVNWQAELIDWINDRTRCLWLMAPWEEGEDDEAISKTDFSANQRIGVCSEYHS